MFLSFLVFLHHPRHSRASLCLNRIPLLVLVLTAHDIHHVFEAMKQLSAAP